MSAAVLPLVPVRTVRVFWDFDFYTVLLCVKGRRSRRVGRYGDLADAERAACRVRRLQQIPTPPIVEPREPAEAA